MLERGSLLVALLLAADGLHLEFQQQPAGARFGQAGQELSGAAEVDDEADWPWHFGGHHAESNVQTDAAPTAPVSASEAAPPQRDRLAVLVTGSVERLLLAPLLSNVVRANAKKGFQVDLFLSLQAPSKIAQADVDNATIGNASSETSVDNATSDPQITQLLQGASVDNFNSTVMDQICSLARAQLASSCQWDIEGGDLGPIDGDRVAADVASGANQDGAQAAVARWRSQSRLWSRALAQEQSRRKYAAVLVAPGDSLWMAPMMVDVSEFHKDPMKVSVMSCSDSAAGIKRTITSEATVMGREAAGAMLQLYQVSSSAEEVASWVTRLRRTNVVPEPKPVALATYTQSGLPCFRKESFNLTEKEGQAAEYQQCFGEPSSDGPLTSLFNTFGCEDMNPAFYGLLWPQQVKKLHAAIAELAGHQERKPVVLTVIDNEEEDLAYHMIKSLQAAGEAANSLVVGTVPGICRDMDALYGVPSKRCIVVQPAQEVRRGLFRHAILTTAALAGLSDRITLASPRVAFTRPTGAQRGEATSRHIVFATSGMTTNDTNDCGDSDGFDSGLYGSALDTAVVAVPDAPGVTNLLLRAWARMVKDTDVSQKMALAGALEEKADNVEAALLSCSAVRLQETEREEKNDDDILAALAPGQKPPPVHKKKPEAKRVMDGEVDEDQVEAPAAPKPKPGHWDPLAKKWVPGESEAQKFKNMWDDRIKEIRADAGYNETAIREEAIKRRLENRQNHKKHPRTAVQTKKIRYLPQEEVDKVKAKDAAWDESVRKQHDDDLAHADERKEAFKREVEKQMKIMSHEGDNDKDDDAPSDDGDLGAE